MLISLQAVQGDLDAARVRAERFLEVARRQHSIELEAWALCSRAELMFDDPQSMREMLLRAGELEAETDDPRPILRAWIGAGLAAADLDTGDFAGARRIAAELAAADDKFTQMNGLGHLALASLALDDAPAAREAVTRYLHGQGTAAIGPPICWLLAALSITNDPQLAALFIGAAERIETEWGGSGAEAPRYFETFRTDTAETVSGNLGERSYDRLREEGHDTPLHLLLDRAGLPSQGAATDTSTPM